MPTRAEAKSTTAERVLRAAATLFPRQGYASTTIPQIARAAGVSVGTVATVGSKDALFVRSIEEMSTRTTLELLRDASDLPTVTERVWHVLGNLFDAVVDMPETIRDYLAAYLRATDHDANVGRLLSVITGLRGLWPPDEAPEDESPAMLAAITTWLSYSGIAFAFVSGSSARPLDDDLADTYRDTLRRVVQAQCQPFEERS